MYTEKYAGTTSNLETYVYFSQVMQAYALEMAISSLRGSKPFTMGSLYWQLNDVWPVASWSTVDYYGRYKIAHYHIHHLHNPLLIHSFYSP
jgi:beta-mannosidase